MQRITTAQRRERLARRHRLVPTERVDDPVAIADSLVGLHASDPATVHLACLVRMQTPSVAGVEQAMYRDRTLVRHHGMRRTMWVMSPDRTRQMHAAVTEKIADRERLRNLKAIASSTEIAAPDVWFQRGIDEICAVLATGGPATSRALGEALPHLVVPVGYGSGNHVSTLNAHTKMVQQAGFDASIVRVMPRGSWISSEYLWSPVEGWLDGPIPGLDRRQAAAELVRAYLDSFGPVTETDLVWWLGDTKTLARTALADIGAVQVVLDDGATGWVVSDDLDDGPAPEPWVAVLPGLDPTPMGWKEREWFVAPDLVSRVFDRNGNIGPTIWADGKVVGGWVQRDDGVIVHELLTDVGDDHRDLLCIELDRVESALDGVAVRPRFPSRNQPALLGTG